MGKWMSLNLHIASSAFLCFFFYLFCPILICLYFFLIYFNIYACIYYLYSKREKGCGLRWMGKWGESWERGNCNLNILYKKSTFNLRKSVKLYPLSMTSLNQPTAISTPWHPQVKPMAQLIVMIYRVGYWRPRQVGDRQMLHVERAWV